MSDSYKKIINITSMPTTAEAGKADVSIEILSDSWIMDMIMDTVKDIKDNYKKITGKEFELSEIETMFAKAFVERAINERREQNNK